MNVNREIAAALRRGFREPRHFVLAVSGGPDSQCLLKAFPHIAVPLGHTVSAIGINHGLRPEAGAELDLAERLAEQCGVPFRRVQLSVDPGPNLQHRARDARYQALRTWGRWSGRSAVEHGDFIVTAHHADDKAETVMIRLLRGVGAGAMGVLPELSGDLFRPMLHLRRTDVLAYLERWGVQYASDPSNLDEKYLRVWLRRKVMPLLTERSPRIVEKLCHVADDLVRTDSRNPHAIPEIDLGDEALLSSDEEVDSFLQEVDEAIVRSVDEE